MMVKTRQTVWIWGLESNESFEISYHLFSDSNLQPVIFHAGKRKKNPTSPRSQFLPSRCPSSFGEAEAPAKSKGATTQEPKERVAQKKGWPWCKWFVFLLESTTWTECRVEAAICATYVSLTEIQLYMDSVACLAPSDGMILRVSVIGVFHHLKECIGTFLKHLHAPLTFLGKSICKGRILKWTLYFQNVDTFFSRLEWAHRNYHFLILDLGWIAETGFGFGTYPIHWHSTSDGILFADWCFILVEKHVFAMVQQNLT